MVVGIMVFFVGLQGAIRTIDIRMRALAAAQAAHLEVTSKFVNEDHKRQVLRLLGLVDKLQDKMKKD